MVLYMPWKTYLGVTVLSPISHLGNLEGKFFLKCFNKLHFICWNKFLQQNLQMCKYWREHGCARGLWTFRGVKRRKAGLAIYDFTLGEDDPLPRVKVII